MKATVVFHRAVKRCAGVTGYGRFPAHFEIDLGPGRKVIPGERTFFLGRTRKVLAVGWEPGADRPVVHLTE